MSWFDAASFTSYAKTALASAQKSIDKVLDIDEGSKSESASQRKNTNTAVKTDIPDTSVNTQASTIRPRNSLTPKTSREKLSLEKESKTSGDDFWSSFLGSSQNNSSSSSSSSSIAIETSPKKSSRQKDILRRKKSDSKLTPEKSKPKDKGLIPEAKDSKKGIETHDGKLLGKKHVPLESKKENDGSTVSKPEGTLCDDHELTEQALEETSEKTLDNMSDSIKKDENHDDIPIVNKTEIEDTHTIEIEGELNLEKGQDIPESKDDSLDASQEGDSFETTSEHLNDTTFQVDKLDDDAGSMPEPTATSTPYVHRDTFNEEPKLKQTETPVKMDNTPTVITSTVEAEKEFLSDGVIPEETEDIVGGMSTRKEPTEDDCEEEVVKGVLYKAAAAADAIIQHAISDDIANDQEPFKHKECSENDLLLMHPIKEGGDIKPEDLSTVEVDAEVNIENIEDNKEDKKITQDVSDLHKEISDLKEIVNARESKMVALSKENIDLQETNAILRSQLNQLESMHGVENEEFEEMKEEFTTRIATVENKLHQVSEERDDLKTELDQTTAQLTAINERQHDEFSTLVTEKDEQIAQLLSEGEKLSKQELQSNTVIKKLRSKEKENDALISKQRKKLEEYEEEVKRLTDILTSRDDSNSKQEDVIIKLNSFVKKQEEQLAKQTSELEDANEKVRSMQVALDNAYKEMTSLQKQTASTEGAIKEAVLSTEMKAREGLRMALEKTKREFQQESEVMALQVADLQASLSRAEQQGTRREENLRQEIKQLQQRLQESEDRNQELASSVSHATRPLLRQIENLQTTHSGQTSTWERVEKSLTERLNDAQNQLLVVQEKERVASLSVSELNARITRLETQVSSYRVERSRLEADLELERTKNGSLEDAQTRETAKYDAMVKKYQKIIEDTNIDKAHLEQQLTVEKSKMDTEVKKLKTALQDKDKMLSRQSSLGNGIPPSSSANSDSPLPGQQQDTADGPIHKRHSRTSSSGTGVVDGLPRGMMGGTTALVERLQAQIRQKDGEIELLQDDVTSLRQSRDSVTEEMTSLTTKLEELESNQERLNDIKDKYDVLQKRYNAVLQMYGEKEEEAEELRMDLQDVKNMYKQQLEQLFGSTR